MNENTKWHYVNLANSVLFVIMGTLGALTAFIMKVEIGIIIGVFFGLIGLLSILSTLCRNVFYEVITDFVEQKKKNGGEQSWKQNLK